MAHDGQARRARQHHADLPAFPRPGVEPGRERLAVSPPKLALKHRLRKLRRDRRCSMRRLAKTHRSTRNHRVHRNALDWAFKVGFSRYDLWYELHAGEAAQLIAQAIGGADDRVVDHLQGDTPGAHSRLPASLQNPQGSGSCRPGFAASRSAGLQRRHGRRSARRDRRSCHVDADPACPES